jgi:hypothetical protein
VPTGLRGIDCRQDCAKYCSGRRYFLETKHIWLVDEGVCQGCGRKGAAAVLPNPLHHTVFASPETSVCQDGQAEAPMNAARMSALIRQPSAATSF